MSARSAGQLFIALALRYTRRFREAPFAIEIFKPFSPSESPNRINRLAPTFNGRLSTNGTIHCVSCTSMKR